MHCMIPTYTLKIVDASGEKNELSNLIPLSCLKLFYFLILLVFQDPFFIGNNSESFVVIISKLLGPSTGYLSNYLGGSCLPASFVHGVPSYLRDNEDCMTCKV